MKFIKYFIIPFAIIILSTIFITLHPTWKMRTLMYLASVGIVFGSSLFPLYYVFCKMFPDIRNEDTPPQITMLIKMLNKESLNRDQMAISRKTLAFKLTAGFSLIFICIGFYSWTALPEKYIDFKTQKSGIITTAVIVASRNYKHDIGTSYIYKFSDLSGNEYTDFIKGDDLTVGDYLNIRYDKENPMIHKAFKKNNTTVSW